jgi:hypothetical protein
MRVYLVFAVSAAGPSGQPRTQVAAQGVLRALSLRSSIERFVRTRALAERVYSIGRPLVLGAVEVVCAPDVADELARLPEVQFVALA